MPSPTVSDVHSGGSSQPAKPMPALDDKQLIAVLRRLLAQLSAPPEEDEDEELEDTEKAYPNTHSARQLDPAENKVVGSKEIAPGVRMLFALKDGKSVAQSIHFDATKFTVAQARAWLKAHDYSAAQFTAAGGEVAEKGVEFQVNVLKVDEEERTSTAIVYPVKPLGWKDTQQDWMSKAEIRKMAHRFMVTSQHYDMHHKVFDVGPDDAAVVESWLSPVVFTWPDTTQEVTEGSWIVTTKYGTAIWPRVKAGEFMAYSIRGKGHRKSLQSTQKV